MELPDILSPEKSTKRCVTQCKLYTQYTHVMKMHFIKIKIITLEQLLSGQGMEKGQRGVEKEV